MNQVFKGWDAVAEEMAKIAQGKEIELNEGQAASLRELAKRLPHNGVIIADEVGMGKTRIAAAVARSVIAAGGRVAVLVPPGLGYQWGDELGIAGVSAPPILRSLWQYLHAWMPGENNMPWFQERALIVSHSFSNWRLGEKATSWRWALLPEMYAKWRKEVGRNLPKTKQTDEYKDWIQYAQLRKRKSEENWPAQRTTDENLRLASLRAANSVIDSIKGKSKFKQQQRFLDELIEMTPWPGALTAAEYRNNAQLRPWLERAVGLGLGLFDLIIVDEAHKSRRQESGLNQLLTHVILKSTNTRCLAMTATPVELDATQWTQMLERVRVDEKAIESAKATVKNYAEAVTMVRQCPSDSAVRERYKASALAFKVALNPYLLRRDKREDSAVIKFRSQSGEGHNAYRREQEILIDTAGLTSEWKQAVCAAEALSFVSRQADGTHAKRLRLTLGSGHGIASMMDQIQQDDKEDKKQILADAESEKANAKTAELKGVDEKRLLRAEWWQNVVIQPFMKADGSALFDHPAILAAVEEIESTCREGEKVLVFGRFTRPLRALVQLLNAREMLRCLRTNRPWPQSKVHEGDNEKAIVAAYRQLEMAGKLDFQVLNHALAKQYQIIENQRRTVREKLINLIETGFNDNPPEMRIRTLFDAFKNAVNEESSQGYSPEENGVAAVARAVQELIGEDLENPRPSDFAQAFIDLVSAASDRDEGDSNGDGQLDDTEATALWANLYIRINEEYNRPEGGFARLMYGETRPATRRFLQLAFNRKSGNPKVLVAQSLVGREGLNLHKACRTIVLLHPEWNPGVVEQQIGRVDRIGSLWEEKLNQMTSDEQASCEIPRIEIRPVVFRGTYDEKNWQILHDRWDDLRAQLHGIVISPRIAEKYSNAEEMIADINDAAPNFSPSVH
jgi:superfamily II DNA or RNA helicase